MERKRGNGDGEEERGDIVDIRPRQKLPPSKKRWEVLVVDSLVHGLCAMLKYAGSEVSKCFDDDPDD